MLVDFQSEWFKLYCKALLASEPENARELIKNAITRIDERLGLPDLGDEQREAMLAAVRYLSLISETELPKAS